MKLKYAAIFLAGLMSWPFVNESHMMWRDRYGYQDNIVHNFILDPAYGWSYGISRRCTNDIVQPRYDGMQAMPIRQYFSCGWLNIQISDFLYGDGQKEVID